jgi:DNA-binding HxlR family transcriptional regulator
MVVTPNNSNVWRARILFNICNECKEFVFHDKKLQTTLNELQEHQIIVRGIDEKSCKEFVRIDIEMFGLWGSVKTIGDFEKERWFSKMMNHELPLKAFFHLVDTKLNDFYVHHLQHTKPILFGKIDFKTALVLMVLVRHSNQFGITNKCGIHKLKHKTGLSKDAIFRCIKKLKQQGLIRTRVDGTQSSKIVRRMNPFYALNLSHELWGIKLDMVDFILRKVNPLFLKYNGWSFASVV